MEQRIGILEKKVQELETALVQMRQETAQGLAIINSQMGVQLMSFMEDCKDSFKEATLEILREVMEMEKESCPRCKNSEIRKTGRYCKICGLCLTESITGTKNGAN